MDEIVEYTDYHVLSRLGPQLDFLGSQGQEGSLTRQIFILYCYTAFGGTLLYLILASTSYYLFFVHWKHFYYPENEPQPFKGQVLLELKTTLRAVPLLSSLTLPFLLADIRGLTKLYAGIHTYGLRYFIFSIVLFIVWSDSLIYWIHRELHDIKWAYRVLHKRHHLWKVPTPFAAIAFHPVDGWLQSLPYHLFPFVFPLEKWLALAMFVFVQCWTVFIHDGVHITPFSFINGAAHHTFHHSKFNYNYGQYFVFWDKLCGSYMDPFKEFDPLSKTWKPRKSSKKLE